MIWMKEWISMTSRRNVSESLSLFSFSLHSLFIPDLILWKKTFISLPLFQASMMMKLFMDFSSFMSLLSYRFSFNRSFPFVWQMFYSFALKHPMKQARDDICNVYGLTPLTMACLLGRDQIFAEIIELKCFVRDTFSHHHHQMKSSFPFLSFSSTCLSSSWLTSWRGIVSFTPSFSFFLSSLYFVTIEFCFCLKHDKGWSTAWLFFERNFLFRSRMRREKERDTQKLNFNEGCFQREWLVTGMVKTVKKKMMEKMEKEKKSRSSWQTDWLTSNDVHLCSPFFQWLSFCLISEFRVFNVTIYLLQSHYNCCSFIVIHGHSLSLSLLFPPFSSWWPLFWKSLSPNDNDDDDDDDDQEFWTYSIITCCGYPLNLIDSIQLVNTKDGLSSQTGKWFKGAFNRIKSR